MKNLFRPVGYVVIIVWFFLNGQAGYGQEELPDYLKDRGTGIPTSMFGTYINQGAQKPPIMLRKSGFFLSYDQLKL